MVKKVAVSLSVLCLGLVFFFNNCSGQLQNTVAASSSGGNCGPSSNPALNNPSTIDETVAFINTLPRPLTLDCFIKNLARPLNVVAAESTFSAQPSQGARSPRIFIVKNNFVLSVVPAGPGRELLEMSQYISSTDSVKGEIAFPISGALNPAEPYNHILANGPGNGTNCRTCHIGEYRTVGLFAGEAYASQILRPQAFMQIPAATMKQEANSCNPMVEPYRCAILRAVYVDGRGRDTNFP